MIVTEDLWIGVLALAVAVLALVVAVLVYVQSHVGGRRHGQPARVFGPGLGTEPATGPRGTLVAFVANPSKPGVSDLRDLLVDACQDAALPEPLWFETTIEDPGRGQARAALEAGADIVVAVGGDGTVRAVAESMVGTRVSMGILPRGTGNLLARNLDIPLASTEAALATILSGHDRHVDVGWMRVDDYVEPPDPDSEATRRDEHLFLVIAGLGFDAAMVADADDGLKSRMGWFAYFLAGMRHLHSARTRATITIDDREPTQTRLRSLMVGNCGLLPGGLTLIPDAVIDDGKLDVVAIDTRVGLVGWAQLFGEVVLQGVGMRNDLPAKVGRIETTPARRVTVAVEGDGEHVQVDGDALGKARAVTAWVEPGALVVRSA